MKYILLIIIIILILPYHSFSNEYIIIRMCKAMEGCAVNTKTGECPTCVDKKIPIPKQVEEKPKPRLLMINKKIDNHNDNNDYDTPILNFVPLEELCKTCYWRK